MENYTFYFDETFHDRKITQSSLSANNYFNSYISVGIGIKNELKSRGIPALRRFEKKYKQMYKVEELKSNIIKKKKYEHGVASFDDLATNFYHDFFEILHNYDFIYYISVCDKLEYILLQCEYDCLPLVNKRALIYSIVKAINTYKPKKIIFDLLTNDSDLINDLKEFFQHQIILNGSIELKKNENEAFLQALLFLNKIEAKNIDNNFRYEFTFLGLRLLCGELKIEMAETNIFIDKEGTNRILNASKKIGFKKSKQYDSKKCIGIRASDILCGFLGRMMRGIYLATYNDPKIKYDKKHWLEKGWFKVNKKQFELYKIISKYIKKYSNNYYGSYVSIYFDLFDELIGLIYYFDEYNSYEDYIKNTIDLHFEKGNQYVLYRIKNSIMRLEKM